MARLEITAAVQEFLASRQASSAHSHHTIKAYACDLKQLSAHFPPRKTLSSLTLSEVEGWLASLAERSYAPASRRRKLASLRLLLNHFVRRGALDSSPLQLGQIRIPLPAQLPRALELADARAIVAEARSAAHRDPSRPLRLRDRTIIEILLSTGIRVGELVALRSSDYQRGNHALLLQGKGNQAILDKALAFRKYRCL